MGYVNDTQMAQFMFPGDALKTAGTWAVQYSSNVAYEQRNAADAGFTLLVPVKLPSNGVALKGAYLKSIDVWYDIATAAADDFATVELAKTTLPVTGSGAAAATVAVTLDGAHDTAAKRKAVGQHRLTATLDVPVWIDDGEAFCLALGVDAAATTVFKFYGARANYTLRV